MKTGMEPWFDFWQRVKYAVRMVQIERANWKRYQESMK